MLPIIVRRSADLRNVLMLGAQRTEPATPWGGRYAPVSVVAGTGDPLQRSASDLASKPA